MDFDEIIEGYLNIYEEPVKEEKDVATYHTNDSQDDEEPATIQD